MVSPIVHFQLAAKDIEAAKKFYTEVMGWDFTEGQPGSAGGIDTAGAEHIVVSGTVVEAQGAIAPGLDAVIRFDDVAGSIVKSSALGGTTLMEPTLLP